MNHKAEIFVAIQRILPQHFLSRLISKAAESKVPWLKNILIRQAIRRFDIDLSEAETENYQEFESFNAFFTRALKPLARPIDNSDNSIVSPADGQVSQSGALQQGQLLQAKGINYSATQLLGDDSHAEQYREGKFITIYLSPKDYHRVHMPFSGQLLRTKYIPGELFSVNDDTAQLVPGLFARNERLVCSFKTSFGNCEVILVGAMLVAGIETVWGGFESPNPGNLRDTDFSSQSIFLNKGDEMGRFKFGSTVVLLSDNPELQFTDTILPQATVRMGQRIGQI